MIESEFQAMASEIDRIANATKFNGIHLLNGDLQGAHDGSGLKSTGAMKIHFGPGNNSAEDYYYIDIQSATIDSLFDFQYGYTGGSTHYYNTILGHDYRGINYTPPFLDEFYWTENGDFFWHDISYALRTGPPRVEGYGASIHCCIDVVNIDAFNIDSRNFEIQYDHISENWSIVNSLPGYPGATISKILNGIGETIGAAIDLNGDSNVDININFDSKLNNATYDTTVRFDIFEGWAIYRNDSQYTNAQIRAKNPLDYGEGFEIDLENSGNWEVEGVLRNNGGGETFNLYHDAPGSVSRLTEFTVSTQSLAQEMLTKIDGAIIKKDKIRAHLGAMQNRLENTVTNLNIQAENLQAAESRISDTDVATEMTEFVRSQILTQASVAMLAQANSLPRMAMQLIGG